MGVSGTDLAALLGAIVLAALGGELFLRGILGTARCLRVPKLLVATTLAAFATSSPELTVSTVAALAGKPEIGLGDALGSNVVNIALIFGIALLFGPIGAQRSEIGRDLALALTVPLLTLWMAADGTVSRPEGWALLAIFAVWMAVVAKSAASARETSNEVNPARLGSALLYVAAGLVALVLAGRFFVTGATGIATAFGIAPYVIGATVVAFGTSLPELVTVLLARWRGYDEVGVGTLLGSNLFNGLAIVGTAASIHPIRPPVAEVAVSLLFGVAALLLVTPSSTHIISRSRGVLLLLSYAAFASLTVWATGRASFW